MVLRPPFLTTCTHLLSDHRAANLPDTSRSGSTVRQRLAVFWQPESVGRVNVIRGLVQAGAANGNPTRVTVGVLQPVRHRSESAEPRSSLSRGYSRRKTCRRYRKFTSQRTSPRLTSVQALNRIHPVLIREHSNGRL